MKKLMIISLAALCGCATCKTDCNDCDDCYAKGSAAKKPVAVKSASDAVRPGKSFVTYAEYTNLLSRVEVIERAYARRQAAIEEMRKKRAEGKNAKPFSVNPTAKATVKKAAQKAKTAPAAK